MGLLGAGRLRARGRRGGGRRRPRLRRLAPGAAHRHEVRGPRPRRLGARGGGQAARRGGGGGGGEKKRRSGWTIYVDLNRNGRLDRGEPAGETDADGRYGITN